MTKRSAGHLPRLCAGLAAILPLAPVAQAADGLPSQTWPAGTELAQLPHGGRITTFHRGLLYLGGTDNQATWVYDITDPTSPQLACSGPTHGNSHVWYKLGDLFFRQDLASWSSPPKLFDLSDPCAAVVDNARWTTPIHDFPLASPIAGDDWMATYPWAFANSVLDARVGWWPPIADRNLQQESGVGVSNRFRIGNLLFYTPGDGGSGVAVWDIGDPANPRQLDVLAGNYQQYTTTWHVWRHYLVMMIGNDGNGPDADANALVIDFSDPGNLEIAWTVPRADLPGRYVHFQDHYAFSGHFAEGRGGGDGVKYDMLTRQVVRRFAPPNTGTDFQWIPLGHLLLVSGSEVGGSGSTLYTHQDGLDTTPPSVGYHQPADGAVNQPLTTAVGLVIHEQLDATTVNEQTIQLRPLGGEPVPAIVMHTSYDVVNVVPVSPLQDDTTYELRLVDGGVRDVAGNAVEAFSFHFSTGESLALAPTIEATSTAPVSPLSAGDPVTLSVTATHATQYRFDAGDGSGMSAWSSTPSRLHVYTTPGVFTWQVQARGAAGDIVSAASRIVVDPVAAAGTANASTSILVDDSGRRVWAVNPDHGSVAVFDADAMTRLAIHQACANPRSLARDGSGRAWIACRGDDRLLALDADGAVVDTIDTGRGSAPSAIVMAADGSAAVAALAGSGELVRFDTATGAISARTSIGFDADALAWVGDDVFAARLHSSDARGEILRVDAATLASPLTIALPLDTTTADSGTSARGLPNYVAALAVAPDRQRIWYAAKKDNIGRGLSHDARELTFETTVRVLVGGVDAAAGNEIAAARSDIDNRSLALSLASTPGGAGLFVALAGNDELLLLDPWNGNELARADTGATPRGIAADAQTGRVWVRNDLDRDVSVFAADTLLRDGSGELSPLATIASTDGEVLPAQVLAGKRLFHAADDTRIGADGYIACASCHLDGGGDARVWDFFQRGEGLRRTTRLTGRGGDAHGPIHWSGNFDEVQDFEHDIRAEFGGTGLLDDAHFFAGTRSEPLGDVKAGLSTELDALAAYLGSLDSVGRSPYREADGSLGTDAQAGKALFASLGCAGCHGGEAFTDSPQRRWHDVGTITADSGQRLASPLPGIDTPTLRGLWQEPRFLHDGSAADLAAVFTHAGAAKHAALDGLSTTQRASLAAWLLAIDDDEPAAAPVFTLALAGPAAAGSVERSQSITLAVTTDIAAIDRVDYLLDGEVVATANAAPWQAGWTTPTGGMHALQIRVTHAGGTVTTTWPQALVVQGDFIFHGGFEALDQRRH